MSMSTNPTQAPPDTEESWLRYPVRVQEALEQVLSSPPFRNTQQCQNLLRYIVKHTLAGEDHLLRERVIGSEVFGRKPDYETGEDPVVRLRAAEVRKRLAQFYQSIHEPSSVLIEIPAGSYRATFRRKELSAPAGHEFEHPPMSHPLVGETEAAAQAPEPAELVTAVAQASQFAPRVRWSFYGIGLLLAFAAVAVVASSWGGSQASRFRAFWAPWTGSSKPIIISIGSNAVYQISETLNDQYAAQHHLETHGDQFFIPFAPDENIQGRDIVAAENSFVALGDVAAVSSIVASLTRQKQVFQERFPNDISFAELRESPSLLVGGFNNPMTLELTKSLRFVLGARNVILDRQDSNRRWQLHASVDSHDTEDYAIVTRVTQRHGDSPILAVAGMGQYGTLAAANFVCSPAAISDITRALPKDWANRNLQLILKVKVVDFKPIATQVIAVNVW